MTAKLLNISEQDYHADKLDETPTLSVSIGHTLTSQSPAHAYLAHPRLGGQTRDPTDAQTNGSLIHELVLGDGPGIEVIDADSWRTKAAKESRCNARAEGKTPVLVGKFNAAKIAAHAIRERIADLGISLDGGAVEQTIHWQYHWHGGGVACRSRLDWLDLDSATVIDFKTIKSANPDTCARHMLDYGYAMQGVAYPRAVEDLRPDLAGKVSMLFLFCEIEPPFAVTPATCAGSMREIGRRRWDRAVELWDKCLTEKHWPGYVSETIRLEAPAWAVAREMEEDTDDE